MKTHVHRTYVGQCSVCRANRLYIRCIARDSITQSERQLVDELYSTAAYESLWALAFGWGIRCGG